jgi:glycolate oxidase
MQTAELKANRVLDFMDEFKTITGEQYVLADDESLQNYGHDETENLLFLPDLVIRPRTAE